MPKSGNLLRPPALRGDDALGFLAAVGLVALAEQAPNQLGAIRLAWEGSRTPKAVYETDCRNLDELGERLRTAFESVCADGRALPEVDPSLPTKKVGSAGGDPMRDAAKVRSHRERAFDRWTAGERWHSRWLSALVAPAALHPKGHAELTLFYAPAGQMTLRGIFEQAIKETVRVSGPGDALTGWQRADGYQGANLDARAVRTAEFRSDGKPSSYGAPSPTWLALLGMRLFPVVDDGSRPRTTGWLPLRLYPGYTRRSLVWPTWDEPLDAAAISAICATAPLNELARSRDELEARLRSNAATLRGLGIGAVFGASRRTADQADGPLGPAVQLWREA